MTTVKHFFCVFDGHGPDGSDVAQACMIAFHDSVATCTLEDPHEKLRKAYKDVNDTLTGTTSFDVMDSGSTAVTLLLRSNDLYLAHVGDSRAVLGRRAEDGSIVAVPLTDDQTPLRPDEAAAVKERGGKWMPAFGGWPARVVAFVEGKMHSLMMTRSLGDHIFGDAVGSEPELGHHHIEDGDECVVIASDGVWEMLSNEEVLELVTAHFKDHGPNDDPAADACQHLIARATERWAEVEGDYRDDITATIIRLPCLREESRQASLASSGGSLEESPLAGFRRSVSMRSLYVEDCTPRSRAGRRPRASLGSHYALGVVSPTNDGPGGIAVPFKGTSPQFAPRFSDEDFATLSSSEINDILGSSPPVHSPPRDRGGSQTRLRAGSLELDKILEALEDIDIEDPLEMLDAAGKAQDAPDASHQGHEEGGGPPLMQCWVAVSDSPTSKGVRAAFKPGPRSNRKSIVVADFVDVSPTSPSTAQNFTVDDREDDVARPMVLPQRRRSIHVAKETLPSELQLQ